LNVSKEVSSFLSSWFSYRNSKLFLNSWWSCFNLFLFFNLESLSNSKSNKLISSSHDHIESMKIRWKNCSVRLYFLKIQVLKIMISSVNNESNMIVIKRLDVWEDECRVDASLLSFLLFLH
jgi:hypothetical protein